MTDPNPSLPVKPISELVTDPDFPNSAVGKQVDIRGYTGVIVEVVKNSIKVRSAEGQDGKLQLPHPAQALWPPPRAGGGAG